MEPTKGLEMIRQRYLGTPEKQAQLDELERLYQQLTEAQGAFLASLSRDSQRSFEQVQALPQYEFAKRMVRTFGGRLRRLTVQGRLAVVPKSEDQPLPSKPDMDELSTYPGWVALSATLLP